MNHEVLKVKPPRTNKVTVRYLEKLGACVREQELFRKTFPRGMELTTANLVAAADADLSLTWVAAHVLKQEPLTRFHRAAHKNSLLYEKRKDKVRKKRDEKPGVAKAWERAEAKIEELGKGYYRANARALAKILGLQ